MRAQPDTKGGMAVKPARLAALAAVCLAIGGAVLAAQAFASGASGGGVLHIYFSSQNLKVNRGADIVTGAITDHGTDRIVGGSAKGTIDKFSLSKGSFEIRSKTVTFGSFAPVNPKTCSFAGSTSIPGSIVKGSGRGAYAGISGTLKNSHLTIAGITPRSSNGTCNTKAGFAAGVAWGTHFGTISLK